MKTASRNFGVVALAWAALVVLGVLGGGLKIHAQVSPPTYPEYPESSTRITYSCPPGPWCYDCSVGSPTAGCTNGARPEAGYTRSECLGGGWSWNECTGTSWDCGTYQDCTDYSIIGPCMKGKWCSP